MLCSRVCRRKIFNAPILKSDLNIILPPRKSVADIQIVVIGAGLAGLSAASHLIKHGFKRTLILEATDRYGGRVNSRQFGDAFCELGAKWVSIDASKDSMYELLQHANGLPKKIKQRSDLLYVNTMGQTINRKLPILVDALFRKLCSSIELKKKVRKGQVHDLDNVHTYFTAEAEGIVNSLFKQKEQEIAKDIFVSLFKEFGSLLGCCLERVNIEHIIKMKDPNATPIYIPTGLDNILNVVTNNIDERHMKVGTPVGEIKWHANSKQEPKRVGCMDGSAFQADHIICTLPLGVLKNFSRHMFKPALPNEKLKAINNIGFGSPVKIYFEYDEEVKRWLPLNLRPLWSKHERASDLKWTKQVVEISKLPTSNRVIEILVGGAFYDEIENLPDEEVLKEITTLLRNCLKNPKIPYATSVLRSKWSSSACYLGGRPYLSTGSTMSDVHVLAAPLGEVPTLLFAGDATILQGFGTLDGARMSGIREATRIIDHYKRHS